MTIDQITNNLADLIDYLKQYSEGNSEQEQAIIKLEEAVFWLSYCEELIND